MRRNRIFVDRPMVVGDVFPLPSDAAHHAAGVLRLAAGASLTLFNGEGGEYAARITGVQRRETLVEVCEFDAIERESRLCTVLIQGISRGERMEFAIQKAVELGVSRIVPVRTQRSDAARGRERDERRTARWQNIIRRACEQCGRNTLPAIEAPSELTAWLAVERPGLALALDPVATSTLASVSYSAGPVELLIGPEGGLSDEELKCSQAAGFMRIALGPRTLRTETAAVAALSLIQSLWGDL